MAPYLFAFNNNNNVPAGREKSKQMVHNVLRTDILIGQSLVALKRKVLLAVTARESCPLHTQERMVVLKTKNIFMVDGNPRGVFWMYTTTSKFHFRVQKWWGSFVLVALANMLSKKTAE